MKTLKKIHFYFGVAVIAHFLITGLLMKMNFFSIEPQDTLVRMMLRANHIYILFSGLINLLVSSSIKRENSGNKFYFVTSSILIIATIGISISFYIDPINHLYLTSYFIQRKLTGYFIIGCLVGTGLHLLLLQFYDKKSHQSQNR
ncbi:MAG: hypothetical protein IPO64_17720 [Bacteroidetes bacterium]|nr:hypothetical protein [Bacteroidota bacterium]